MSPVNKGRILIVVAAVMWSTSGLFAKAPILDEWPADIRGSLMAFWRACFAGLFLLPFAKQIRWSWKLLPATLVFAAMNVTFLTAMSKTTAANSIWLQSTSPLWVFLIGVYFQRQAVARSDWILLLFAGTGVGVILYFELSATITSQEAGEGVIWALCSGFTLALVVVSLRKFREMDSTWLISIYHLVTAGLLFPVVLYFQIWPGFNQFLWLALFGTIQMGLPYVLVAKGLKVLPSHEAAFLMLLEPILVPVWVWLAWHAHPAYLAPKPWTLAGAFLILTGLLLRYLLAGPANLDNSLARRAS